MNEPRLRTFDPDRPPEPRFFTQMPDDLDDDPALNQRPGPSGILRALLRLIRRSGSQDRSVLCTMADIAREARCSLRTIKTHVKRLEAAGYLKREIVIGPCGWSNRKTRFQVTYQLRPTLKLEADPPTVSRKNGCVKVKKTSPANGCVKVKISSHSEGKISAPGEGKISSPSLLFEQRYSAEENHTSQFACEVVSTSSQEEPPPAAPQPAPAPPEPPAAAAPLPMLATDTEEYSYDNPRRELITVQPGVYPVMDDTEAREMWERLWRLFENRSFCEGFIAHQRWASPRAWMRAIDQGMRAEGDAKPHHANWFARTAMRADKTGVYADPQPKAEGIGKTRYMPTHEQELRRRLGLPAGMPQQNVNSPTPEEKPEPIERPDDEELKKLFTRIYATGADRDVANVQLEMLIEAGKLKRSEVPPPPPSSQGGAA